MIKTLSILVAILAIYYSCNTSESKTLNNTYSEIIGETQGTYYRIVLQNNGAITKPTIDSLLHEFDLIFSNYIPNSTISIWNESEHGCEINDEFKYLLNTSMSISKQTNGAFDISCAPLVNAWKFGFKNDSLLPTEEQIQSMLLQVGMNNLKIQNDSLIKLNPKTTIISNAIAQGYSTDIIADYLESKGIVNYLIDIGGEMRASGVNGSNKTWVIGINIPKEGALYTDYKEIVTLKNSSLATSGNYRKFYEIDGKKYSHTIDPRTGYPVRHSLLSATIITPECINADALATACMVIGLEKSKELILSDTAKYKALFIYEEADSLQVWKNF